MRLLLDTSASTLADHLDRMYAHNKRLKARGRPSRSWYVSADAWLTGMSAAPAANGRGFFENEVLVSLERAPLPIGIYLTQAGRPLIKTILNIKFWISTYPHLRFALCTYILNVPPLWHDNTLRHDISCTYVSAIIFPHVRCGRFHP